MRESIKKIFTYFAKKERVKYYLGNFPRKNKNIVISNPENKTSYFDLGRNQKNKNRQYRISMRKLLKKAGKVNNFFLWQPGDVARSQDDYLLSKIRTLGNKKVTLLKSLTEKRHWGLFYNRPKDIPFDKKINKLIWRGATTDKLQGRVNFVRTFFNKYEDIDVGFSKISPSKRRVERLDQYVKGKMLPKEMLNYKYILSIPGNDKDSGLNWKLNSNSLVIMPKPDKESWLMEFKLVPGVHFVEIKKDFSDLREKLDWCKKHEEKCRTIIKNAHNFMQQFKDLKLEKEIEHAVLKKYFNNVEPILGLSTEKLIKKTPLGEEIVFLHAPKCAGSFITRSLEYSNVDFKKVGHRNKSDLLWNKIPFYNNQNFSRENAFIFTVVRNPWDRLVSAFFHLRDKLDGNIFHSKDYKDYLNKDFSEFVKELKVNKELQQIIHLIPLNDWFRKSYAKIDFFVRFEKLNEDLKKISKIIGVEFNTDKKVNTSDHKNYKEYYDKETKQIVTELYKKDIEIFGYTFDGGAKKIKNNKLEDKI